MFLKRLLARRFLLYAYVYPFAELMAGVLMWRALPRWRCRGAFMAAGRGS